MSSFKEKSQIFIVGVMVGLIVAGGFFILKLDGYFKELNFYKSFSKTFSSATQSNETVYKAEDAAQSNKTQLTGNKVSSKKISAGELSQKKSMVLDADTLNAHVLKDSLISGATQDDIVVRKDELLFTKTLEILNLNPVASKTDSKDSLLQKISGIKDERNSFKQFFNIEFWQSPLNYKGYKMSKYKIVLYGIPSPDELKIVKLDDGIYLKTGIQVYRLDYSADFKPYERVTDELLINKLK